MDNQVLFHNNLSFYDNIFALYSILSVSDLEDDNRYFPRKSLNLMLGKNSVCSFHPFIARLI